MYVVFPQSYLVGEKTQSKDVNDKILKEAEEKIVKIAETIGDRQILSKAQTGKAVCCQRFWIR